MAARLISPEDVANACNDLVKSGEQPSTTKIYAILKQGSYGTIQKFIAQWRESDSAKDAHTSQLPAVVKLPDDFVAESELFIKKIFKLAEQEHAVKSAQIQAERDQAVSKAESEVETAINFAEERGVEVEDLIEKVDQAVKNNALLEEEIGRQKAISDELSRKNNDVHKQLLSSLEKNEGLSAGLSALEIEKALLVQERDAANGELVKAQEKCVDDIKLLKAEQQVITNSNHADHVAEIKSIKGEYKAAVDSLKIDHEKAKTALTKAHDKAVGDLTKANDKTVSVLDKALVDAQKQRDDANASAIKMESKLAESNKLIAALEEKVLQAKKDTEK